MTDEEFAQILALGHETRGIEFKGPGALSNGRLAAQVVRAVLGMANQRDGGLVIIGVENNGGVLNPVGLSEVDLATWEYDLIADQIARYADPSVSFGREIKEYNNVRYVVLGIEEFSDIPVLCKRAYADILRDGACYVRSRRKPETSETPTSADMRDLLELATEKRLQDYLAQLQRLGLIVLPTMTPPSTEQFERQRSDLDE
jgi:predicted HTH transcriptional regulator